MKRGRELIHTRTVRDESGCWIWQGPLDKDGYGKCSKTLAHIYAHRAFIGPVPDGLEIDHRCRVRACANPDHLEAVTHLVNVRRASAALTHCKHGHEVSGTNTYISPKTGYKTCRPCNRRIVATRRNRTIAAADATS